MTVGKWAPAFAGAVVMLLAGAVTPATAAVAYSTGPANGLLGGYTMSNPFTVAHKFTLASAASIDTVGLGLWIETGGTLTELQWAILDAAPSAAGTAVSSGSATSFASTPSPVPGAGYGYNDVFDVSFSIAPTSLAAGDHWLQLHAVTTGAYAFWDIASFNVEAGEQLWDGVYYQNTPLLSFTLSGSDGGAVPEPGAWALMILGFGLAGAGMRHARQTVAAG